MEMSGEVLEEKEEIAPPTQSEIKLTEEQQKMNALMQRLIEANTTLIVKTAACDCKRKNTCKVYLQSQEIAKIIDELQELRPK